MRQIIHRKIGSDFLVTKKPITTCGSNHFSPYCRLQHDVCIQHPHQWHVECLQNNANAGFIVVKGDAECSGSGAGTIHVLTANQLDEI